ncbi:MAG TPA: SgcJ/EcaC family oxidoreductase [Pyrinomonadaceae bacterium]
MKNSLITFKLLTALATFSICVVTVTAQQAITKSARPVDEAAIRENVRQMEAGWNEKSGSRFAQPFAEDADYVVINGRFVQGREAIEKEHQHIFNTVFKNTTLRLLVKQIRFVRPDVAVVHVTGQRDTLENEKSLVAGAFMTLVMTREKQGWRIAAFQNTQIAAPRR